MDTSPDTNLSYIYTNGLGKPILYNVTNNDPVIPHGISVPLISVISLMIIGGKIKISAKNVNPRLFICGF